MHFLPLRPSASSDGQREGARRGSLLLEAIITIAVFSIFIGGIGLAMILGERSTIAGGDRTRAAFLAEQGLEAVRYLRDQNFSSLSAGTYSPIVSTGGIWSLKNGVSTTSDQYRTSVQIVSHGTDWIEAVSKASWNFGKTRSGTVVLSTYLTNWRKQLTIGNWASAHIEKTTKPTGGPSLNSIALSGTAAFLTGTSSTGAGLYVYNVTTPSNPTRIATSFSLGKAAYDVLIDNNALFVATSDMTQDIRRYTLHNPNLLSASSFSGSYDLPSSPRALAMYGTTLFVGTVDNATGDELFALEVTATGFTLLDSLDISGGVTGIRLHDGYAYLSTGYDAGELQVVDVFDPSDLQFVPGRGMDLGEVNDALSVAAFGTSALIGRAVGSTIDELVLYSIAESPLPSPPPGPWTREIGGNVNAIDLDPGGTYGFLATNLASNQFRTFKMSTFSAGGNPLLASINVNSTLFDLVYDWRTDRVFAVTAGTLLTIAPGP